MITPTTSHDGAGPRMIRKSRSARDSVNASRTLTRFLDRRGVARSRFVRIELAGRALCALPLRELGAVAVLELPALFELPALPESELPPDPAPGDDGEEAPAVRVGDVTTGGATERGGEGVVVRGGVTTVTGGVGSAVVTGNDGGGGAGGSAVVTGNDGGGGAGGSAVVIGSEGAGGSAVVMGSEGVVTVTPGTGGTCNAKAWAAKSPARAATKPKSFPKRM